MIQKQRRSYGQSAARYDVKVVKRVRQLSCSEVFWKQADERFVKRQVVKQLLGPLIAARENGLSFEQIAAVFERARLPIAAETLRSYFFELKTEAELAREARRHAARVTATKQTIDRQLLEIHQRHGHERAYEFMAGAHQAPRLYNALGEASATTATAAPAAVLPLPAAPATQPEAVLERPAAPAAAPAQPARAARDEKQVNAPPTAAERTALSAVPREPEASAVGSAATAAATAQATQAGEALTIDDIEQLSEGVEDKTVVTEDLSVREGRVYCASGTPFRGTLTRKQIHVLRTVGRIIARTIGRTSKDFVRMPSKI